MRRDGRTELRTEMTKLIVDFRNYLNAPKTFGSLNGLEIFIKNQTRRSKPNLQPADLSYIDLFLPKWYYDYCPCVYLYE
jgi:hypothetical protein